MQRKVGQFEGLRFFLGVSNLHGIFFNFIIASILSVMA